MLPKPTKLRSMELNFDNVFDTTEKSNQNNFSMTKTPRSLLTNNSPIRKKNIFMVEKITDSKLTNDNNQYKTLPATT